jgi:hypothetical protein
MRSPLGKHAQYLENIGGLGHSIRHTLFAGMSLNPLIFRDLDLLPGGAFKNLPATVIQ